MGARPAAPAISKVSRAAAVVTLVGKKREDEEEAGEDEVEGVMLARVSSTGA